MAQTWSETSVNHDGTNAVVGMFGSDEGYFFYMEFEPNQDDEWWDPSCCSEKIFAMLFQMGETQSEWTGVWSKIQSVIGPTQPGYYELDQLSVSNNAKMSGLDTIDEQKNDNSEFEGYFKITDAGG